MLQRMYRQRWALNDHNIITYLSHSNLTDTLVFIEKMMEMSNSESLVACIVSRVFSSEADAAGRASILTTD